MTKVAIVGSGVVGQASGKGLIEKGHQVIFADVNEEVLNRLEKDGLETVNINRIEEKINEIEVFFLSVSTPTVKGKINLDYIKSASLLLGQALKNKQDYSVVVFRSTLPPGTSRKILVPILERASGLKAGKDFGVCMNPEYLREIKAGEDFLKPRVVAIGALDEKSFNIVKEVYEPFDAPIFQLSLEEAEMQKYVHNIFNATKIAFFNEMRLIANELGVDADKIFPLVVKTAEASWNPEYGIKDRGPFNGMCLPKDTEAFKSWVKDHLEKEMPILGAVIESNNRLISTRF